MVNRERSLDLAFSALGHPIRRRVLERLSQGEQSVSELAAEHEVSLPAFLKQLAVLERAGFIATEKVGRVRRCRFLAAPLSSASNWIERHREFWEGQLDALERYLETNRQEATTWRKRTKPLRTRSKSAARSRPVPKKSTKPGRKRPS